ncbi:MAG: MFS transporter [Archaeoglobus sp.]|uniref:MFS transporter n=1 Tax=Archaeoglobus sp. TaxID=1872626 RepID=UPI001D88EBFE|nr:MFS transporter [Archaeoglobus sp.]MBO8179014.1 MFS transporter [Archaeoglobus sp.]
MKAYRYRWVVFGVMALIYFFVYFHRTSPAVLATTLMGEFAVTALAVGVLSSAYFYPYGVMQIPVGYLSDTKGPRLITTVFTLIAFLGTLLFALSPTFEVAILGRLLIGVGVSGVYIPTIKILSQWFKDDEFATLTGVLFAVGNVGALASAYPLAAMVSAFGWRGTFFLIGAITLVLALSCWIFVRDSPGGVLETNMKGEKFSTNFRVVVQNPVVWLIATSAFLRYGIVMGYQGLWGGPYLMDVYGMQREEAGGVLMMVGVGTIFGAPVIGFLSDKVIRTRKWFLVAAGLGFTFTMAPLVFLTANLSVAQLYMISFLIGLFSAAGPVAYALIKESYPLEVTGLATSIVNVFPFFGGAVFQVFMGYLMDTVGMVGKSYPPEAYSLAFSFCLVASLASAVLILFVHEKR